MLYAFITAILILIISLGFLIYWIAKNKKNINLRILKLIMIAIIIALSCIAFLIEPKESNDLYRHFKDIELIRNKGFFAEQEFNNVILIKLIFLLVSFLPSNHFLPAIAVIITYGISMCIIYDFSKKNQTSTRVTAIAILLNFALCSFYMAASGIRNAMACSFLALGLYLDLIKNKKFIIKVWPYIVAALIHPMAYIVIVIRILLQIKWIEKVKYLVLLVGILYRPIIKLFYFINLGITNYLAQKMDLYLVKESIEDIRWLLVIWAFLIFIYIVTIVLKKENENIKFKKYLNFIQLYILFIFAFTFVADVFTKRLTFLLAFFMIPLLYLIENHFDKKQKVFCYAVFIIILCGLIPYGLAELKNTGFMLG